MSETHLNIIKRLEAEANFCNKNPNYCSIRTFDILEDARGRIEELVVENKRLKAMYDAATGDREDALRSCDKVTDLLFETQIENERLEKAAKKIMIGFDAPKFNPTELALGKNVKFSLSDPETAYYWGWEAAILECGEILSK